jgi:spore germination protein KA
MLNFRWLKTENKRLTANHPDTGPASQAKSQQTPRQKLQQYYQQNVSSRLEGNISFMQNLLGASNDFVIRRFRIFGETPAALMFFREFVDQDQVNKDILRAFMYLPRHLEGKKIHIWKLKDILVNDVLYHNDHQTEDQLGPVVDALIDGKTAVFVEGIGEAFLFGTRSVEKRSISQPETEQVVRGPREGFIESLKVNLSLLRYRLQTPDLRVKMMSVGRITRSKVAVCFIEGIANPDLVAEVEKRLSKIDVDGILGTGYIEQYIEDNPLSPFPQIQNTERPDKTVANLLEGRVAILVDGSPFAIIVPTVFSQFYQTVEDYEERFLLMSFIRLFRLIALTFSLIFPALYVSIISFNPELIPTEFVVAVAGGRAGVPFPSIIEVMVMEVAMEVLREATVRLPQQVGGALSIVGVLVVGQAAVSAGFASPITVVVIALTTIGSFAIPAYNAALAFRLLRFPLLVLAGMFGLYGVMIGLILIINHLLSLKSFGVPYISPVVPASLQGMKDVFFRFPFWLMNKRPGFLFPTNKVRVSRETMENQRQTPNQPLDGKHSARDKNGGRQ